MIQMHIICSRTSDLCPGSSWRQNSRLRHLWLGRRGDSWTNLAAFGDLGAMADCPTISMNQWFQARSL